MSCWNLLLSTILLAGASDPSWDQATVAAYAVDTKTGRVVIDQMGDKSLLPASCMKIVTTAAALKLLGPESCFQTDLEYDGTLDEAGVLHGNLYIRGGGDPCLGSNRIGTSLSWEKQIQTWVHAVQKLGIRKITGEVIGDAARWEMALAVPSWNWEDVGNYYGAGACALSFHENSYSLVFKPGNEVGKATSIVRTEPSLLPLVFQNEVKTGSPGSGDCACIYGSEFSAVRSVRGTIPAGVPEFAIKGAISDPPAFCADALAQALVSEEISIEHKTAAPQKHRTVFHTTYSPPIKEIVYATNQDSVNLYAEHLLKRIGERVHGEGSTEAGIRAVTDFWRAQKIDLKGFNMADGSGLSRKNLITAKQLVAILLQMKQSGLFPLFLESLPQKNDKMRAKSGSMSFVKAYAGYSGEVAFALLVNQCLDPKIGAKTDLLLSKLLHPPAEEYPASPSKR